MLRAYDEDNVEQGADTDNNNDNNNNNSKGGGRADWYGWGEGA